MRPLTHPAIIGLSGGPDSLALLAAAAAEGKDVRAVVIDHGLQPGSGEVAQHACEQAERLGVPAEVIAVEVPAAPGESLEALARTARYEALARAATQHTAEARTATPPPAARDIWVAHTMDDHAETLLLGALRGNPAAMASIGEVPAAGIGGLHSGWDVHSAPRLVRPFLGIRRADTVGACDELGLEPWHDPMNQDPSFRRVAVRKQVVPQLSELIGGDAVPALAAAASRIVADRELLDLLIDVSPTTDCASLAADPAPVRRRRLLAWLRAEGITVTGSQLSDIERLCTNWHGQGPVTLRQGAVVMRIDGQLHLHST
ncbi:tRNA(Ile)-lysidine synthase [Corynebacterium aquatimens]|uniref:tRNA(Ile)-lysidine synthase n=1 Tax=Corynebacterium aquatimens TaxID=1190508 RepID=A0A931GST2_9CORY|nr:tRNA(Ile)-lysidine synthase [Corynebacterium aquatimens]WJY65105.1 tRNA(Ile)-lysidine synthase [Corynebacterium aquatimens]